MVVVGDAGPPSKQHILNVCSSPEFGSSKARPILVARLTPAWQGGMNAARHFMSSKWQSASSLHPPLHSPREGIASDA